MELDTGARRTRSDPSQRPQAAGTLGTHVPKNWGDQAVQGRPPPTLARQRAIRTTHQCANTVR
jgi:hypothetical protein